MGAAARRNPRSLESSTDEEARALILLRDTVAQLRSREAFERWLLTFPRETQPSIRAMLQSAGPWTVENRRKARIAQAERTQALRARAREMALWSPAPRPPMGVRVME